MVVSMGRGVGDGKVVDGGLISRTVIFDMMASKKGDIGYGRMTFGVVVFSSITSDIMTFKKGDINDDGDVTCGVAVSSKKGRGDGRLVDGKVVFGAVTSYIVASMRGNRGDGRVVFDTTCSKGEGLGEGDSGGERGSMEASSANRVDDVDVANMASGGCIDH